eukprot:COSAG05_NODE_88_length_20344_cov_12.094690_6_plen_99_part_00
MAAPTTLGGDIDVATLAKGHLLELCWAQSAGGDGDWYEARVSCVRADGSINFTYLANSEWNDFDECVPKGELGSRLRAAQRRRSARPKKELKFSYRDL